MLANGIGFVLSAQVNFVLSARSARWARFNTVALVALAVNELVFTMGGHAGIRLFMASAAGIVAGAIFTFTLNNLVTFRDETTRKSASAPLESRPSLAEISGRAQRDGVAFFLPAFNEAANLRNIVP